MDNYVNSKINQYVSKYNKPLCIFALIILSPYILSVFNILVEFIFKCGNIVGNNLRLLETVLVKFL